MKTTKIVASEVSAPELEAEQRDSLSLEIQPNSLVDKNGQKLDSAGDKVLVPFPPETSTGYVTTRSFTAYILTLRFKLLE